MHCCVSTAKRLRERATILRHAYNVCFWRDSPQWATASSFTRFLDHTQRSITVGRTPLDDRSVRRQDLYLTIHIILTTDKRPCPRWDSSPQSQQTSNRRPRGHWGRHSTLLGFFLMKFQEQYEITWESLFMALSKGILIMYQ
jgi:hypothetical protein